MLNHTTMQTLRALLSDRAEVVSQIAALKAEVAQIEIRLSELVAARRPDQSPRLRVAVHHRTVRGAELRPGAARAHPVAARDWSGRDRR